MFREAIRGLMVILVCTLPMQVQADVVFFDHFEGSTLGSAWIVKNPDPSQYSIANSKLNTFTLKGDLHRSDNNYKNLFLIANPLGKGDFRITLKVLDFFPESAFQQVDIIVYDDDDNYIKCLNGMVAARNWEFGSEVNGTYTATKNADGADNSNFYLRLTKTGNIYRQYFSLDGSTFVERNIPVTYGNGAPPYFGFIALEGGVSATPVPVSIDFFKVESGSSLPAMMLNLGD